MATFSIGEGVVDHDCTAALKRCKRFTQPHHFGDLGDLARTQCKNFQAQGIAMPDGDIKD